MMKDDEAQDYDEMLAHWMRILVPQAGGCYAVAVACRKSEGLVSQWMRGEARPIQQDIVTTSRLARNWGYWRAMAAAAPEGIDGSEGDRETRLEAAIATAVNVLTFSIRGGDLLDLDEGVKIAAAKRKAQEAAA